MKTRDLSLPQFDGYHTGVGVLFCNTFHILDFGDMIMVRAIKFLTICLLAGLSACTNGVRTDVATFHTLTKPAGETYALVALDPKKQGGLELGHYKTMVKAELDKLGYSEARSGRTPDLTVRMDFEIAPAREELRPSMSAYGSPFGYGHRFSLGFGFGGRGHYNTFFGYNAFSPRYYGFYDPFYRPFGYHGMGYGWGHYGGMWAMSRQRVVKIYDHHLEMNITRGAGTTEKIVFEGKATTQRRRKNMQTQMPVLVAAMFKEFPGESGKHRRVLIELPKMAEK